MTLTASSYFKLVWFSFLINATSIIFNCYRLACLNRRQSLTPDARVLVLQDIREQGAILADYKWELRDLTHRLRIA